MRKKLCRAHARAVNEWTASVHSLAAHPAMAPLDNGHYAGPTRGRRAADTVRDQIRLIRTACARGAGCG